MTSSPLQPDSTPTLHRPDHRSVTKAMEKRSYCTIATVSPAGRPHAAGVLYELIGNRMYINTLGSSRKARNVASQGQVGVVIPVRRVPVGGPPSAVQFQATASILSPGDPEIQRLVGAGHLSSITSHGELELPDSCFIRIDVPDRLLTYGLGMSLLALIRDPLAAAGIAIPAH